MKVAIIIPAFNEEANIARLVAQILAEPWQPHLSLTAIVIVDDCSLDATDVIARRLEQEHSGVHVIRHAERRGKNAAIRTGANAVVDAESIAVLDADLTLSGGALTRTLGALDNHDEQIAGASCIIEPLAPRSWRERASYTQALLVAELKRCGAAYLSAIYVLRASARDALATLPDDVPDDAYITVWLREHGYRYVVCRDAVAYIRAAMGLRDFAKQTLRGRQGELETHRMIPSEGLVEQRSRVMRHVLARTALREPLGFLLYALWYTIVFISPQRLWLRRLTLSTFEAAVSTKRA